MQKKIGMRVSIIIIVLLICLISIYPPKHWDMGTDLFKTFPASINLGLDLKGGTRIVLQADREKLEQDLKKTGEKKDIKNLVNDSINKTLEILRNRIDEFGVAEPSIKRLENDRIEIELPGLRGNADRVKQIIQSQAVLEFKLVHKENDIKIREITDENGNLLEGAVIPNGYILMHNYPKNQDGTYQYLEDGITRKKIPYLIQDVVTVRTKDGNKPITLKGEDLETAYATFSQADNRPIIAFKLKPAAADDFEKLTSQYRERDGVSYRLAIILDNKVLMAPSIKNRIPGGSGIIEGNFTIQEVNDMALTLRSGALPVSINIIEEQTVGPTLGADAIRKGLTAAIIGFIAVVFFMLVYYLASGIIADIALLMNLFLILGILALIPGATLTLPGVAGIILTVGMAVDANVIVYERIKEEILLGKGFRTAIEGGYSKAFSTIADANITTVIVAIVLYQFGAGPIRGFAVTLIIGIVSSMFTALFVTRTMFYALLNNFESVAIFSPFSRKTLSKK